MEEPKRRCFKLLAQTNPGYLVPADFKPFLKILLTTHPGLEFLQATPEFQERYSDTVIMRIFFMLSRRDDSTIAWKDFKNSSLFKTLLQLEKEDDINKVRDYFSYEHFYVLYCKFWELDTDHDFFITKEEFSRY